MDSNRPIGGRGRGRKPLEEQTLPTEMKDTSHKGLFEDVLAAGDIPIAPSVKVDTTMKQLFKSVDKSLNINTSEFTPKPKIRVTEGRTIELITNHFKLGLKSITAYHYDIDIRQGVGSGDFMSIAGPKEKKMRKLQQKENMEVMAKLVEEWPEVFANKCYVFDGLKNLYTTERLQFRGQIRRDLKISLDKAFDHSFEVWIQFANEIPLSSINDFYSGRTQSVPEDAFHVLEIILRFKPTQLWIPVGRSLYTNESNSRLRDCRNVEMAYGHYQAVHMTEVGSTLLVDRTATLFRTAGSLLDFVLNLMPRSNKDSIKSEEFSDRQISELSKQMSGLRIKTEHLGKRSAVIDVMSKLKPDQINFQIKGIDTNVLKYFEDQYKIKLKYPNLPCVKLRGGTARYLPIEICSVAENQPILQKHITPAMTASIVSLSGQQKPFERFEFIKKTVKSIASQSAQLLEQMEIQISEEPIKLNARVLDKPNISGFIGKKGGIAPQKVFESKQLLHWCLICITHKVQKPIDNQNKDNSLVLKFVDELTKEADIMGIKVEFPKFIKYYTDKSFGKVEEVFNQAIKHVSGLQLIVFCIPYGDGTYHKIKHLGDIKNGVMTQCLQDKHLLNIKRGFLVNFLLKINGKLDGTNSVVTIKENYISGLMVVGADVTHPAPADRMTSSVAAVIGSYDEKFTQYSASIRVQRKSKDEIITDFGQMFVELLSEYKSHNNNNLPKGLLLFRDGVSEGQFAQVLKYEYKQIKEACIRIGSNYCPKITFIVVQKRHHTRFIPANHNTGVGMAANIPPGTVIDNTITDPILFEYYLCSHSGLIGTSRPSKYVVLHDDHNFTFDEITKLSYQLCHSYVRTSQSISVPVPVMYSHLAAKRSKDHIIAENMIAGPHNRYVNEEWEQKERRIASDLNTKIKVDNKLKKCLYYC